METQTVLSALQEIEKRAEGVSESDVVATYVDIDSLVSALRTIDNGVIFGRRGTGKTHALKYLAASERAKGNRVIYIDLEHDVGSSEGIYGDTSLPLHERATRLVVDILGLVHNYMLELAFDNSNNAQITYLDRMIDHFQEVLVKKQVQSESQSEESQSGSARSSFDVGLSSIGPSVNLGIGGHKNDSTRTSRRTLVSGEVRHRVHFGGVTRLMRSAIEADSARRYWLLLDEWSEVPIDLQPYLAEMLKRLFFGIGKMTVRIGAIAYRSEWSVPGERGDYTGIEIGAELFPLLDLDEFVVFPARSREEQAARSSSFFRTLFFRHISTVLTSMDSETPRDENELVSTLFTQITALNEVVRAAEGVPRDALSIVARAGLRAGGSKIAVTHIREAAAQLYTTTKASRLNATPQARQLLEKIVDSVISGRKARAFLLAQEDTRHELIQQLVNERILHIIKRGYSSKDKPGERFDVLQIDYGCYVHLLGTVASPQGMLGEGLSDGDAFAAIMSEIEVPEDDYRAIRRAILDLPKILGVLSS